MTPQSLSDELELLVKNNIKDPVLILGEPGVGKSAIVNQVAKKHGLSTVDVRWGQMSPVDVRGVPVIDHTTKSTAFYPPNFWPRTGPCVIFLDEFNMASTAMMGLAQQLLLDRKFGDYIVPDDVFVWAAGNRKIDKAAVNDIPAPVMNRVAHYTVDHDVESWQLWAHSARIDPRIIGFVCNFRTNLLYKVDPTSLAWPSPRTWEMADRRFRSGMSLDSVIGEAAAAEFSAYVETVKVLPDLKMISEGKGEKIEFPEDPSLRYAVVSFLISESMRSYDHHKTCFQWLSTKAIQDPEFVQMFVLDVSKILQRVDKKRATEYMRNLCSLDEAKRYLVHHGA